MSDFDMNLHFEKTKSGHTRWVGSRELHERGLISDEQYAMHVAAMEELARELREEGRDE